eukprot:GFUD01042546.1.p1 GENE.GFUD01042546.1~~GFUD01042546.1.p1  ORF type:complete len:800 (+),score=190.18 GFUD01042546.1:84-2483(+)
MSTDFIEFTTEAEFFTTMAENLTEIVGTSIENITETIETITETIENITEKAMLMTSLTPAAAVESAIENITETTMMMTTLTPVAAVMSVFVTSTENTMTDAMTNETTTEHQLTIEDLRKSMDTFFLIINSFIIFFLQGGFAFLEAGSVRSKNTTNILIKNLLDILLACLAFWAFGYMFFQSEGNTFIGTDVGYMLTIKLEPTMFAHWFWSFTFCATAATIVSGAVAERCNLAAYFAYSIAISGLIYPVVAHWAWTPNGWLRVNGYIDFAGSGVVHHLGGVCGFVGAVFLGPRIGRFDVKGKPVNMPGHSVPLAALGAFILLFGFFAFNGSTQAAIGTPEDMVIVQRAVTNTMIGGCSSGLTTLFVFRYSLMKSGGKWSLLSTINGTLCGMITTCAFCNLAPPHITFIIGIFSAFVYVLIHHAMIWLKIDDPLDAVAVHSGGGMLGVLVTPLVIGEGGVFDAENGVTAMHQIWSQLVGLLVITAWSGTVSAIIFYVLKLNKVLRVSRELELQGLDMIKHGEAAYPAEAWREIQYQGNDSSLPPHMTAGPKKKLEKYDSYEMMTVDEKVEKMTVDEKEVPSTTNKMVGTWSKVNQELKKQMLNFEDYKDSEVVLTVKPLGFRKLVSESDTGSIVSSELEKKKEIGGFTNGAFEDDDFVDDVKLPLDNAGEPFKETHFGGSWKNIHEQMKEQFHQVDNEEKAAVDETDRPENEGFSKIHSSTLKLDVLGSDSDRLSGKIDFKDDVYPRVEEDSYPRDDSIYEQMTEQNSEILPLAAPRQRLIDEHVGDTTLEFNNSKESSMI